MTNNIKEFITFMIQDELFINSIQKLIENIQQNKIRTSVALQMRPEIFPENDAIDLFDQNFDLIENLNLTKKLLEINDEYIELSNNQELADRRREVKERTLDTKSIGLFNQMFALHEMAQRIELFYINNEQLQEPAKDAISAFEPIIMHYLQLAKIHERYPMQQPASPIGTKLNEPQAISSTSTNLNGRRPTSSTATETDIDLSDMQSTSSVTDIEQLNEQQSVVNNTSSNQEFTNPLEQILIDAIEPSNHFKNYNINRPQLVLIKDQIGPDLFKKILNRYDLSEKNFTLDDLRMVIIGFTVNCNQSWNDNHFMRSLLKTCSLKADLQDTDVVEQLRSKVKLDEGVWNRISAETRSNNFLSKGLEFFKQHFLSKWSFLFPVRFKSNNAFKRDYKSSLAIANIADWQNKSKDLQQFASLEYTFNNLASADFIDGAIIPVLNAKGEKNFYKVKNIIDANSIHGFALVPIDPEKSLDIKVIFKNSKSLSEAIADTEHYLPYREFKTHKKYVMQELNKLVEGFKQEYNISDIQAANISLDIGGQGTGGTLASHLMHELVSQKAHFVVEDFIKQDPNNGKEVIDKILEDNITAQFEYQSSFKNYKSDADKKEAFEKYKKRIKKYARKHLLDENLQLVRHESLIGVNNLNLSNINSRGVPVKIRDNFIQSLRLLNVLENQNSLHIHQNKIVNEYDIIKKAGATDLGAYMPPEIMPIKILKVTSEDPEYTKHLKNIGFSTAMIAARFAKDAAVYCAIPHIAPIVNLAVNYIGPAPYNELLQEIVDNVKTVWHKVKSIHSNNYLNSNNNAPSYEIIDNSKNQDKVIEELNDNIGFTNHGIVYRKIKKKAYQIFRKVQNLLGNYNPNIDIAVKNTAPSTQSANNSQSIEIVHGFTAKQKQQESAKIPINPDEKPATPRSRADN